MVFWVLIRAVLLTLFVSVTLVGCGEAEEREGADARGDAVVLAAGDIARCPSSGDEATGRLLGRTSGKILTLGDNAYQRGSASEYARCYDPSWGRFEARTKPSPGNHEYYTPGAAGYFEYFGTAAGDPAEGYYSYDLGDWHMVALNSNCEEIGGCSGEGAQVRWLRQDLAKNQRKCTLAYFHHPLFTAGRYSPGIPKVKPLWEALHAAGADVVLNGHDHNYQRFAPQDPEGAADPERGIREFVVGTGGADNYPISRPTANVQAYNDDTFGVLKLDLHADGYEWEYVPAGDATFTDSGSTSCH